MSATQNKPRPLLPIGSALLFIVVAVGLWFWSNGKLDGNFLSFMAFSKGTLEIRLKDHREAIGDFAKLDVVVNTIRLSQQPANPSADVRWIDLSPQVKKVDLTRYTDKNSAVIYQGAFEGSEFKAIHLKLDPVTGTLKKNQQKVPIADLTSPIKLPFSIRPRTETGIVLDLVVLDISDHIPLGYELHIKGYELYTNGRLVERIPPA